MLLEPGYVTNDYLVMHVFAPVRRRDKIRRNGVDYEIVSVQDYAFKGETAFRKATCRRLISPMSETEDAAVTVARLAQNEDARSQG